MKAANNNIIVKNKNAARNYHLTDKYQAGIVLEGWEVKGLRDGKVDVKDSYVTLKNNEAWVIGLKIDPPASLMHESIDPTRSRKLLLNKKEINKLIGKMQRDGFTIVPTKMYFKKGKAKIELAIAKGKKQFDKRATKKNRDWNRDKARYIRKSS